MIQIILNIHSFNSSKLTHQIKVFHSLFYLQTWSLFENCQVSWSKNLNIFEETKTDGLNLNLIKHLIKTNTRYEYLASWILDTQTSSYVRHEAMVFCRFVQEVTSPWYYKSKIKTPAGAKWIIWSLLHIPNKRGKMNEIRFTTLLNNIKKKYFPAFQRRIKCKN